jgi:curved DNA binding protein
MSDSDSDYEGEQQELDLSNSDVVTKYKAAADIANNAIAAVVAAAKPGAKIVELCSKGDAAITEAIAKVFKGKKIEKGVAFPTCVSVNSVVGHFCPVSADDATELKEGDVAKIDLGVHIDGFIATEATTVAVQSDTGAAVSGRAADVISAAATALEAALRLIRPGRKISDVAEPLQKVVEAYGCQMVEGVLSHQMKQFVIDANKCVLHRPSPEAKVEDGEFEENEVYAVDIVVSTGEGKTRVLDEKETAVYKRALEEQYKLKMKASRTLFSEVNKRFPTMPFALRALEAQQARFGLVECLNHGLLHPYPVLHEKTGELVAQFKATVLLMPNGSDRVTNAAPTQKLETDKKVEDEELVKLLATSLKSKSKKKKSNKKKAKEADAAAASAAAE